MQLRTKGNLILEFVFWAFLGPCGTAGGPEGKEAPAPGGDDARTPNIVLIISDDHCWTDYSFMGHEHVRTPSLDKLASQSLVFRRGYVPSSLCCPSLATIITGLYPHQHKVTCNDPPRPPELKLKPKEFYSSEAFREGREVMTRHLEAVPTLPRLLAQKGYLSLQTGKWWQGDHRRGGFTDGMTKGTRHGDEGLKIGRETLQPIRDFIEAARKEKKPFFIWYAPMMPHDPHDPPLHLLEKYEAKAPDPQTARYWAMVEWFDESCGHLLDHLEAQGLSESTLVLYLADNGWIQGPQGFAPKSKTSPYDGGLRTPIMIRWPGKVKPRASDDLAMSIDLVPTILAAVGMRPASEMQGVNLLDEEALRGRKAIFGECFTHDAVDLNDPAKNLLWRWMIEDRWKIIVPSRPEKRIELYDLLADPGEDLDLAGKKLDLVGTMRGHLDAWWKPGP
jgi:arylsulfatase A-like enzyme